MLISFDPGETTGIAEFNEDGSLVNLHQLNSKELVDFLSTYAEEVSVVIYEEYQMLPYMARRQAGKTANKMPASRAIGAIMLFAKSRGAKLIKQRPNIKPAAIKLTQVKPPSNHANSHQIDAYLHGAYYFISMGITKSALEKEMEAENAKK